MGNIAKQRHQAAVRQSFHCFYCGLPMWEASPAALMHQYSLTPAEARLLQCTGEHLKPRGNGALISPQISWPPVDTATAPAIKPPRYYPLSSIRKRYGRGWVKVAGFQKGSPARSRGTKPIGFRVRRFKKRSEIGYARKKYKGRHQASLKTKPGQLPRWSASQTASGITSTESALPPSTMLATLSGWHWYCSQSM